MSSAKPPKVTEKELIEFIEKQGFYKLMDDKNKAALAVMKKDGPKTAVDHMMSNAGGDYGAMRMMYG